MSVNRSADPTRRRPRARLLAPALVGLVGLSLLASACGSSKGHHVAQLGGTATASARETGVSTGAVAFAQCMRSNGVPNYPDPSSSGVFDKAKLTPQQLGASSSRIQAAQRACQHLLPSGPGSTPTPAEREQVRAQAVSFSRCVRSHGVPNFPDPGSDGRIPDPATVGIDQGSPTFERANQACGKYRPPYMPSNGAYNSYARTHG
jgi:hypothetical protein